MTTEEQPMMGKIDVGYTSYVLPFDDAVQVIRLLANAKRYAREYSRATTSYSYNIWDEPADKGPRPVAVEVVNPDAYRIGCLAGEPGK